jgi:hypothetical protein
MHIILDTARAGISVCTRVMLERSTPFFLPLSRRRHRQRKSHGPAVEFSTCERQRRRDVVQEDVVESHV